MEIDLSAADFRESLLIYDEQKILITKETVELSDTVIKYIFRFEETPGSRYSVKFLIPADAANAYVTLNGKKLLGFFNNEPQDIPVGMTDESFSADSVHIHETTLVPGEHQKINFRWFSGDTLIFYIFQHNSHVQR